MLNRFVLSSTLRPCKDAGVRLLLTLNLLLYSSIVLATGLGNPPAVRVWTGYTVRFCPKTVQQPDLLSLGGVGTQTGLKPAEFWPRLSDSRVSFS